MPEARWRKGTQLLTLRGGQELLPERISAPFRGWGRMRSSFSQTRLSVQPWVGAWGGAPHGGHAVPARYSPSGICLTCKRSFWVLPRAKTPSRDHPRARPAARAEPAAAHLLSLVNGRVHARPSLQANLPGAGAAGRRQVLSCLHLSVALPLRLAPPRNRMLFSEAENLARYTAKLLVGPVEKNRNRKVTHFSWFNC